MEDSGFSLAAVPIQEETKIYMRRDVEHFQSNGLTTAKV